MKLFEFVKEHWQVILMFAATLVLYWLLGWLNINGPGPACENYIC